MKCAQIEICSSCLREALSLSHLLSSGLLKAGRGRKGGQSQLLLGVAVSSVLLVVVAVVVSQDVWGQIWPIGSCCKSPNNKRHTNRNRLSSGIKISRIYPHNKYERQHRETGRGRVTGQGRSGRGNGGQRDNGTQRRHRECTLFLDMLYPSVLETGRNPLHLMILEHCDTQTH